MATGPVVGAFQTLHLLYLVRLARDLPRVPPEDLIKQSSVWARGFRGFWPVFGRGWCGRHQAEGILLRRVG